MSDLKHNSMKLFFISEACACFFVLTFIVMASLSRDVSPLATLSKVAPLLWLEIPATLFIGLLMLPFMFLVVRDKPLRPCLCIMVGAPAVAMVLLTPVGLVLGFWGGLLALGWSFVACNQIAPSRYPAGMCQACGYNLKGNTSGMCPECGTVKAEVP